MVRKASSLIDIYNVFEPKALTDEEEQNMFYQKTATVRDGSESEFHDQLFSRIEMSEMSNNYSRIFVIGHMGCGKSTELRMLARKLRDANISPIIITAFEDFDYNNFCFVDILMKIVERLVEYAKDNDLHVKEKIITTFQDALATKTIIKHKEKDKEGSLGPSVSASIGIPGLFQLTSEINASLKTRSGLRDELRNEYSPKIPDIIKAANAFIYDLDCQLSHGRNLSKIVIIIDGLEKCRLDCVREMFDADSPYFTSINAHVVIACPINVHYSLTGAELRSIFNSQFMPMIKTHIQDSSEYTEGIDVVKELILRRVDASLFNGEVLKKIIVKTGGCLRDTFILLKESAFWAYERKKKSIDEDSLDFALNKFVDDNFLRIKNVHYKTVKSIYDGNHEMRDGTDIYELLYSGAVLKYNNGTGWIDLHPLIRDYINDHPGVLD